MNRPSPEVSDTTTVLAKGRTANHDYLAVAPPLRGSERKELIAAGIGITSFAQFESAAGNVGCTLIHFDTDRRHDLDNQRKVHVHGYAVERVLRSLGRVVYIQNQVFSLKGRKSSPFTPSTLDQLTHQQQHASV